ncbi:uncharacterized protein LOC126764125 [Bactrocera neohumeralis]|uniref:uncharacterized protein LOC126764125 n=1 Tax=Bactrocera neohumeralis TaxID=98809 RepID=UPI002166253F|nr:uncharacterized protein LOC126764125 [Bactrocera neohumeralis]
MSTDGFCEVLVHVQKNTRCSLERPILLFLDNHVSHCSLAAIMFCRENGIHMISFPPLSSHKLQPLDISVFGPFKKHLATSYSDFLLSNPGRAITIYDIPQLSKIPFQKAFVSENICKGFSTVGISPFNRQAIPEADFISVDVEHQTADIDFALELVTNQNNVSIEPATPCKSSPIPSVGKTPEQVRPIPRIIKPFNSSKSRKGSSKILRSTPSKKEKEKIKSGKVLPRKTTKKSLTFKKRVSSDESTDDDSLVKSFADTDKSIGSFFDSESLDLNNYVLVWFEGPQDQFYVDRIVRKFESSLESNLLLKT